MGLTVHYSLSLPASTSSRQVHAKLEALRQKCLDLPFKEVSPELGTFRGNECDFEQYRQETHPRHKWFWFLIQAGGINIRFRYDRHGKPVALAKDEDEKNGTCYHSVVPATILGFSTWPGEGCEEANVGLCRFPKTVILPNGFNPSRKNRLQVGEAAGKWFWHSFCKTQYANSPECGGLQSFLRCHLSVIAMLDAARALGFEVEVKDEGGYWEKRDVAALVKEIGEWDAFIAAFGGQLKDAAENVGMTIEAPITERADFERLEAEGQRHVNDKMDAVLAKLLELTQEAVAVDRHPPLSSV